ncbi:MAG TPA: OB-fold nucleic acid binding domain-containing protein [Pedococcus sp.]|jgi:RecG-like helicase|uniref:OB-fold nucleic acid binding domain-containing protein n=1 Tax=Pedococcus sp. TaxID=2860345 RepID=UPI002F93AABC
MSSPSATDAADGRHRSLLARLGERLTKPTHELEADELRKVSDRHGGTPMCDLQDRQTATVSGTVRAVTLRPRVNVPALVVDLYDGSTTINLVWLGRRTIRGIEPGTYLRATGRVTFTRGMPTIFNPAYEIVPDRGE